MQFQLCSVNPDLYCRKLRLCNLRDLLIAESAVYTENKGFPVVIRQLFDGFAQNLGVLIVEFCIWSLQRPTNVIDRLMIVSIANCVEALVPRDGEEPATEVPTGKLVPLTGNSDKDLLEDVLCEHTILEHLHTVSVEPVFVPVVDRDKGTLFTLLKQEHQLFIGLLDRSVLLCHRLQEHVCGKDVSVGSYQGVYPKRTGEFRHISG